MKFNVLETFGRWEGGGSLCRDTYPMYDVMCCMLLEGLL